LARHGIILVPCRPGSKEPAGRWRDYRNCYDADSVLGNSHPESNWAIYCGEPKARLVVLDCDDQESAIQFWRLFGDIPTPIHSTRRGIHALFVWPEDLPLPRRASFTISPEVLPKAELLVDHLALIPPSQVEGCRYEWLSSPMDFWPPAQLPHQLLETAEVGGLPFLDWLEAQQGRCNKHQYRGEGGKVQYFTPSKENKNKGRRRSFNLSLSFSLASNLQLARCAMQKAGSDLPGLYVPCHCPLHKPDRRPSAVWLRSPAGLLLLYDFHDGAAFTIAELYAFAKTGRIQKLPVGEQRALLLKLAKETGVLTEELQKIRAEHERALDLIGNERLRQWWQILWMFAAGEALDGSANFLAPVRRMGELMGLGHEEACRVINLLCALGFFCKAGYSKRGGAQCLEPCHVDPTETKARWKRLRLKRLSQVCRRYVEARLGKELAEAVFRRGFESSQNSAQGENLASLAKEVRDEGA